MGKVITREKLWYNYVYHIAPLEKVLRMKSLSHENAFSINQVYFSFENPDISTFSLRLLEYLILSAMLFNLDLDLMLHVFKKGV